MGECPRSDEEANSGLLGSARGFEDGVSEMKVVSAWKRRRDGVVGEESIGDDCSS
jgi:hypothetical protein